MIEIPTEIEFLIISKIVNDAESPLDMHLSADMLRQTSGLTRLRQVSPRCAQAVDFLLADCKKMNIWLHGPVPVDDPKAMSRIRANWSTKVQAQLSLLRTQHCEVVIHLQPELTSMNAETNWHLKRKDNTLPKSSRNGQTAQKAMTGHHAAALVLCRILRDNMASQSGMPSKFDFRLVFHEVDGSCLEEETKQKMLADRNTFIRPRVLPFWDYQAVGMLVFQWQWIASSNLRIPHFKPMSRYLTLPAMAMAAHCEMNASSVYDCMRQSVANLWRCPLAPHPRQKLHMYNRPESMQSLQGDYYDLPGYEASVRLPVQPTFARWLTETSPTFVANSCWVVWGAEIFDRDEQREAVLMPRADQFEEIDPPS